MPFTILKRFFNILGQFIIYKMIKICRYLLHLFWSLMEVFPGSTFSHKFPVTPWSETICWMSKRFRGAKMVQTSCVTMLL